MSARASNPVPPPDRKPEPLPKTPEDPEKGRVLPIIEPGKSEHLIQRSASGRVRVLASGFAVPGPHGARNRGGGHQHRRAPKFDDILSFLEQLEVVWRDDRCVLRLLEAARLKISAANVAVSRSGRGCRQFGSSTGFPSSPINQRNGISARHGDFTAAASIDRGEHGTLSPIHQVSLDEDQFDVGACAHHQSTPAQEMGSSSATYRRPLATAFLRGTT